LVKFSLDCRVFLACFSLGVGFWAVLGLVSHRRSELTSFWWETV
jgi:hypothetical protein